MGPIAGTAVGLFFALLVLYGSVILFNRPDGSRRHARDQSGAVHEWRARFRERRRSDPPCVDGGFRPRPYVSEGDGANTVYAG